MWTSTRFQAVAKLLIAASLAVATLSGCKFSTDTNPTVSGQQTAPASVVGMVAGDDAIPHARVTITDSTGRSLSVNSDGAGSYVAPLGGMKAPLLIVANDPSGTTEDLYAVVAAFPSGSAPVVANVTRLTTSLVSLLTDSGNPADLMASGNLASLVSADAIGAAVSRLDASLSTASSSAQTGSGNVAEVPAARSETPAAEVSGQDNAQATNQPGVAGVVGGNAVSSLSAQIAQCLTDGAACAQLVDAQFLENGYTSFAAAHPALVASGTKMTSIETQKVFSRNGYQYAQISIGWVSTDGRTGSDITVVAQTRSGWVIVGNQM
ncbi:hypothetical protein [Paludibacterium paludis]|uniref:Uncharacterized protein n=1 Tax=Paludibacterium paludis TaxID=1225769 RepID=A0A918P6A3_9NEIS|nr:hypothetical protein [Paludibacterium paludis]GGY25297.1 hypothetical protein GCM10011289_31090 [Paludibacterium paludis]